MLVSDASQNVLWHIVTCRRDSFDDFLPDADIDDEEGRYTMRYLRLGMSA
jgi:hypothetical protein